MCDVKTWNWSDTSWLFKIQSWIKGQCNCSRYQWPPYDSRFFWSLLFMLIMMCLDMWIQIFLNNLWYVEQYGNIRAAILIQHIGCLNIEELACTLNVIRSQPFNCGQEDSWVQTAEQYVFCICLWCDHYGNHWDLIDMWQQTTIKLMILRHENLQPIDWNKT